jgi:hypothetical protein
VEAGNRCLPFTDPDDETEPTLPGAALRLQAIVARLQTGSDSARPPSDDALTRFEGALNMHARMKSRDSQDGCLFMVGIPILVMLVLWFIIKG